MTARRAGSGGASAPWLPPAKRRTTASSRPPRGGRCAAYMCCPPDAGRRPARPRPDRIGGLRRPSESRRSGRSVGSPPPVNATNLAEPQQPSAGGRFAAVGAGVFQEISSIRAGSLHPEPRPRAGGAFLPTAAAIRSICLIGMRMLRGGRSFKQARRLIAPNNHLGKNTFKNIVTDDERSAFVPRNRAEALQNWGGSLTKARVTAEAVVLLLRTRSWTTAIRRPKNGTVGSHRPAA